MDSESLGRDVYMAVATCLDFLACFRNAFEQCDRRLSLRLGNVHRLGQNRDADLLLRHGSLHG